MSVATIAATFDLLRRVLTLEQRQGNRNTAAVGGVHRYFSDHFSRFSYDDETWIVVEGILRGLRRYEETPTAAERQVQAQILLRRIQDWEAGKAQSTQQAVPIGPVSPAHGGSSAALASRRTPHPRAAAAERMSAPAAPSQSPASPEPANKGAQTPTHEPSGAEAQSPAQATGRSPAPTAQLPAGANLDAPAEHRRVEAAARAGDTAQTVRAVSLDQVPWEVLKVRSQDVEKLERLGLTTLRRLLYYFPRDHYDYRNPVKLNMLRAGMSTTVIGTLQAVAVRKTARNNTIVEARIADDRATLKICWFSRFMAPLLRPKIGQRIAVSGSVEIVKGHLQFTPRDYEFPDEDEATHTNRLVPVYPLTEGVTQRWLRTVVRRGLEAALHLEPDPLPTWLRRAHALPPLSEALGSYHYPQDEAAKAGAIRRLAFDELVCLSIGMARRKRAWQSGQPARAIPLDESALGVFVASLPFRLTDAQVRALDEILRDIARTIPMSRLLQGDVGAGKTVVAACALFMAVRAGMQGAIMAPTEILAEQHYRSIGALLRPHGVEVAFLSGASKGAERSRVYEGIADGSIQVAVGTHAVIQAGVRFADLGLAVVDEQHRFGVEQRAALRQKGFNPHVLAMTATPIPRTLQLTVFGDLDVSVIDARPPGRRAIQTVWEPSEARAFELVRREVAAGRQAYVVCPLVEESEKMEARAASAEQRRLQAEVFPRLRVGLLHGQMKAADKDATLGRFRDGEIDVLVATSVVEVGIDVPNATVMVIEEAQRFGLAQLHQLRGRVGRGSEQSYCVLLAESASAIGQQRLQAITSSDDGFALAARDLELRGPGEFLGTRQSGLPELRVAGLGDTRTIEEARLAAAELLERDADLTSAEHRVLAARVEQFWQRDLERS